jgi:hypothetical protein
MRSSSGCFQLLHFVFLFKEHDIHTTSLNENWWIFCK